MYGGCTILNQALVYKDWRVQYNFEDEWEEKRACDEIQKDYPYQDGIGVEKYNRMINLEGRHI